MAKLRVWSCAIRNNTKPKSKVSDCYNGQGGHALLIREEYVKNYASVDFDLDEDENGSEISDMSDMDD